MRKIILLIFAFSAILDLPLPQIRAHASTSSYTENCSPHFYKTTVVGDIRFTCNLQPALLNRLARQLGEVARTGKKTEAEIDDIINSLNELMLVRFVVLKNEERTTNIEQKLNSIDERIGRLEALASDVADGKLRPLNPPRGDSVSASAEAARSGRPVLETHIRPLFPSWNEVVAIYPELEEFLGKGPDNLCLRCETQDDGKFDNCRVAGSPNDASIREAGEKMGSLMRVYSTTDAPIGHHGAVLPIHFGIDRPVQYRPNFCSMFSGPDYLK